MVFIRLFVGAWADSSSQSYLRLRGDMKDKNKIRWIANSSAVIFFDNWQAIEYNRYSFIRFNGVEKMRNELMNGREIDSWVDVFELAARLGGRGEKCSIEKTIGL